MEVINTKPQDELKTEETADNKPKQRPEKEYITFYNTKDVAQMLGCSPPVARAIMYRADFPLLRVGKALKVSKPAFEQWASKRQA